MKAIGKSTSRRDFASCFKASGPRRDHKYVDSIPTVKKFEEAGDHLITTNNSIEIERRFEKSQNDLVLQASDFSLQGLKEMVDNNVIDLSPQYQRRERWEGSRQSELIESFLLNVPVPPIYLAEEEYGIYSIIDGKQRITAVSDYLNNTYVLQGLQKFVELNGARFRDLPKTLQSALRIRPYIRVITLLK